MQIDKMPFVLTWDPATVNIIEGVHESYKEFLYVQFGNFLARLPNKNDAEDLQKALYDMPDESFYRILEAPEITFRLIWTERHRIEDSMDFIKRAIKAEKVRLGKAVHAELPLWTALGDMVLDNCHTTMYAPFESEGTMPIDYRSPYATMISLEEQHIENPVPREDLNIHELAIVQSRFHAAMNGIQQTSSLIFDFSNQFNKVVIFQRDTDLSADFTSGSSAQFVGRSILTNAHLENVDEVLIAEGIVHEGIHSILYMQEIQEKWVKNSDYYSTPKCFISPWTGNKLPLRPFLQACFVWYGLLNFWCIALEKKAFSTEKIRLRIEQAARGFLVPDMTNQLDSYKAGIENVILDAVYEMEKNVKQAFQAILTK